MNIQSLSFNSDISLLICGINSGYTIYKLTPDIEKYIYTSTNESVSIAKLLDRTNITILVGQKKEKDDVEFSINDTIKDNTCISVWDVAEKKREFLIELGKPIYNAYVVREYHKKKSTIILIVVLKNMVRVFDHRGTQICSKETCDNTLGIVRYFGSKNGDIIEHNIVTLGTKVGEIAIWNLNRDMYRTIKCHQNKIVASAISKDGTLLATASTTGKNIHIYDIEKLKSVYKFRRGLSVATIWDLCFSIDNTKIVCCGDTDKIHIFELYDDEKNTKNKRSTLGSILPDFIKPEYFSSHWSCHKIEIYTKDRMLCEYDNDGMLHIITYGGMYYKINEKYEVIKKCNLSEHKKIE